MEEVTFLNGIVNGISNGVDLPERWTGKQRPEGDILLALGTFIEEAC